MNTALLNCANIITSTYCFHFLLVGAADIPQTQFFPHGLTQITHIHNNNHHEQINLNLQSLVTQLAAPLEQQFSNLKNNLLPSLRQIILTNKRTLAVTGTGAAYAAITYQLLHTYTLLTQKTAWAQWRAETSLNTLMTIDQLTLGRDLIRDIQAFYADPVYPMDFITPLTRFIVDLEKEIQAARRYCLLTKIISTSCLMWAFPTSLTKAAHVQEYGYRLAYLKSVFRNWSVHYKAAQIIGS